MTIEIDENAFRDFERTQHDGLALSYYDFFSPVTALAIQPLLSAVLTKSGDRLLDVACGTGQLASSAASMGVIAFGVDIAPKMIALARKMHPGAQFKESDIEALPYREGEFDRVVCNFGLGHFPDAERAILECVRVLRQGGRLAISWWDIPSRQRIQGLLIDALEEVGVTSPATVPVGPPIFRYSDDAELRQLLEKSGLASVTVKQHTATYTVDSAETLWTGSMGSLARTSAIVTAQTSDVQEKIRTAHHRLAASYAVGSGVNAPPAKEPVASRLRLKAGLIGHPADGCRYTTRKSSSGSGAFCSLMYSFHTSSVTFPLVATQ